MTHDRTTVVEFWSIWVDWWCSLTAEARSLALENLEREQALTSSLPAISAARASLLLSFFQTHRS